MVRHPAFAIVFQLEYVLNSPAGVDSNVRLLVPVQVPIDIAPLRPCDHVSNPLTSEGQVLESLSSPWQLTPSVFVPTARNGM